MIAVHKIVVKNLGQNFSWKALKSRSKSLVQVRRLNGLVLLFRKLLAKVFCFIHDSMREVQGLVRDHVQLLMSFSDNGIDILVFERQDRATKLSRPAIRGTKAWDLVIINMASVLIHLK